MNRIILSLAMAATVFALMRCASQAPDTSKYRGLFATALAKQLDTANPLCAEPYGVSAFPYQAAADWRGWTTRPPANSRPEDAPRPPPDNPLGFKWRDLVAAGLLYESEHLDHDFFFDGYVYELTAKGRALYSVRTLPGGKTQARLCVGKPVLKEILAIGKPVHATYGLSVPVRYVLKVEPALPQLYDGTAKALGLAVPLRSPSGEVLYPEATADLLVSRDTGQVLEINER